METRTDYLLSKTGFFIGVGSVINLAGSYFIFNDSGSAAEADRKALACDWEMVGQDFRAAMGLVKSDPAQLLLPLS